MIMECTVAIVVPNKGGCILETERRVLPYKGVASIVVVVVVVVG